VGAPADVGVGTRRWLVSCAAAALATGGAAALAACGGTPPTDPAAPRAIAGPRVLSYATHVAPGPTVDLMHRAFSERYGGVEIERVNIPGGEIANKMTVLVASNSAPDTVQIMHSLFPAFAKGNVVKPLTPFFNRDKAVSPKDFDPGQNACYTWKGELYALGGGVVPLAAVYANKRLFDAAGLRIPSAQESATFTWDRIVELAQKLTRPEVDQFGLLVEDFNAVPFSGGAFWVNDRMNPTRGAMDDPRWVQSIESWVDWTQRKKIMPTTADRGRLGEKGWPEMFAHGKLGMYLGGPWPIGNFLREEPQLQWEMFWTPRLIAGGPRKFASGGTGWGITPDARNADLSWAFLKFIDRADLSWAFLKFIDRKPGSYEIELENSPPMAVYLSSYLPVNEREIARLKKLGMANIDILVKGAAEVQWWPFHPDWPRINSQVLGPELAKMQRGEVPPAGALRELSERVTRELQSD
jgi:fructooligosaccharide transport system substrate-binding protein